MSNNINIVSSTLQGTMAIGSSSSASSTGNQSFADPASQLALNDLFRTLANHGVAKPDLDSLGVAIAEDKSSTEVASKQLGPSVRAWMSAMFSKAATASWQIELGMAGSILASAIQRYYGWP
jgi:hypothetical protein